MGDADDGGDSNYPRTVDDFRRALDDAKVSRSGLKLKRDLKRAYDDYLAARGAGRFRGSEPAAAPPVPPTLDQMKAALDAADVDRSRLRSRAAIARAYRLLLLQESANESEDESEEEEEEEEEKETKVTRRPPRTRTETKRARSSSPSSSSSMTVVQLRQALKKAGVALTGLSRKTELQAAYDAFQTRSSSTSAPSPEELRKAKKRAGTSSTAPRTIPELKDALAAAGVDYSRFRRKAEYQAAYDAMLRTPPPPPPSPSPSPTPSPAPAPNRSPSPERKTVRVSPAPLSSARIAPVVRRPTSRRTSPQKPTSVRPPSPLPPPPKEPSPPKAPSPRKARSPPPPPKPLSPPASPRAGNGAPSYDDPDERAGWAPIVRGLVVNGGGGGGGGDYGDTKKTTGRPTSEAPSGGYVLVRYIARGTFGQVWAALPYALAGGVVAALGANPSERAVREAYAQAEERHARERRAIKLIRYEDIDARGLDSEALSEIALQKHLSHPNVLSALASFLYRPPSPVSAATSKHASPFLAIVMPLERESLDQTLARWADDRKRVPRAEDVERRLRALSDLACALAYLAANGFVHDDLKPGNILCGWDGAMRVADLGLARLVGGANATRGPLETVTAPWRAPELWAGLERHDARSDLWSYALIAFQIIFRAFPFALDARRSVMPDVGRLLGFPDGFLSLVRAGPTDQKAYAQQRVLLQSSPDRGLTRATLDTALLSEAKRDYYRDYYGVDTYRELWNFFFGLFQVDPRVRRNDVSRSPTLAAVYPCRVAPVARGEVEAAYIARTDAYPPRDFPGLRARTLELAQHLWNRLNAESPGPPPNLVGRRRWWHMAATIACKLMDERPISTPPVQSGGAGAALEAELLELLDDPWRGFLVDPETELRKGRRPPFSVDGEPFAPAPQLFDR